MQLSVPQQNLKFNLPFPHLKNKKLSELSTFKIGGPALFFSEARSKEDLKKMLMFCHQERLPFFILGKGSNTLFDDRGFNGLVILNKIDYLHEKKSYFQVGAGYSFARLGQETARRGYGGLEFAAGIPGTCGGAVFMNAGASGQETFETLVEVTYLTHEGDELVFKKDDMQYGYRFSSFQSMKGSIVEACFALKPCAEAKIQQKKAIEYRVKTQPYKDPSIGCIFRNPSRDNSAAFLIDQCGLKGMKEGGAFVSMKHANFIVNLENAEARDVLNLIQKIKEAVFSKTQIHLQEEIRFLPYE